MYILLYHFFLTVVNIANLNYFAIIRAGHRVFHLCPV